MKLKPSRVLLLVAMVLFVFGGAAHAGELVILKGDGLKRDITLSDMQKYVGGLDDISQQAWDAFGKSMPGMLSVAKDSMNAIAVHQELSKGSISGAAKSVLDYGIGLIAGEWESAGYAPLASMMTAFSVYDTSLNFIHSQWFMPSLVDSVYAKYRDERDEGQSHEAVWETFGTYFIQPIKAEVKNKVIYPRHNLKDMSDDKAQATRWVTGKVGPKTVKITCMAKTNWPYSETQKVYIRHKGKGATPLFETAIDIEVWDMSDINGLTLDIMIDLYKLNDIKYPDLENRFTNAQMEQLQAKIKGMLQELKDKDIGPELDIEAEEYIGQMLKVRYAKEDADKLKAVAAKARPDAEKELLGVARKLKEFVQPLKNVWITFDTCKILAPASWSIHKNVGENQLLQVLESGENALIELYAYQGEKADVNAYADSIEKHLSSQPYLKSKKSAGGATLANGVKASYRTYTGAVEGEPVDTVILCAFSSGVWYTALGVYVSSMDDTLADPVISGLKSLTIKKAAPGPQSIVGTWKYVLRYHPEHISKTVVFHADGNADWISSDGSVTGWMDSKESYQGRKTYLIGTTYKTGGNFIRKFTVFLSEDGNSLYIASGNAKNDVIFFTRQ